MHTPPEPDRPAVPVWAWVTIGVLTLAVVALITALVLVVSSGGPENGPTRLEQTGTPPPRLTTTTPSTTSTTTSAPGTRSSTTTTTTESTTTTTSASTTRTSTTPGSTTATSTTGATTPQDSPGPGFEWAKTGPYDSRSDCRRERRSWPTESESCFAEDGSYYFWGVRQSGN